ncbi:ABC transporter ATP-binding protein [Paenarthrobacter sp. C1]|uniref:ABC transporter ATP-binding protein n=1 Tax=Paenarthrobacter sp. C1 TaxID=3400220 RepID=UPI003BF48580
MTQQCWNATWENDMSVLKAVNVVAGYGAGDKVLHEVSLTLAAGQVTALTGVNGAGKSTLASALAGRLIPSAGTITLDETEVTRLSIQDRSRRGVVLCPQGREVFAGLTVAENIRLGAMTRPSSARKDAVEAIFEMIPVLAQFRSSRAGALSGGQQQLVAVGRALAADPKVLIVDEPSMGLAPAVVDSVYDLLSDLKETGVALLVIEESPLRLVDLADHVVVLRGGEVTTSGGAELLRDEGILTAALLGEGAMAK